MLRSRFRRERLVASAVVVVACAADLVACQSKTAPSPASSPSHGEPAPAEPTSEAPQEPTTAAEGDKAQKMDVEVVRGQIAQVLQKVDAECRTPEGSPAAGRVNFAFAGSGTVSKFEIVSGPKQPPEVVACVERHFRGMRVAPFDFVGGADMHFTQRLSGRDDSMFPLKTCEQLREELKGATFSERKPKGTELMQEAKILYGCGPLPELDVCALVKDGNLTGGGATARPRDERVEACALEKLQAMKFQGGAGTVLVKSEFRAPPPTDTKKKTVALVIPPELASAEIYFVYEGGDKPIKPTKGKIFIRTLPGTYQLRIVQQGRAPQTVSYEITADMKYDQKIPISVP